MNETLKQIDSFKEEAGKLQPHRTEFEKVFWDKFRLEFNYNSNHMEGNTLTYGQTKLLLFFDRITGDTKGRDVEEMKAHNVALKMMIELSADKENPLTEKIIREINELILVRPFYNDAITPDGKPSKRLITPGEYKKYPNSVQLPDGNMFYYASPEETPALMGDLIDWYNQNKEIVHPVRLAALMHYKLARIHPFDDSNGRTTRLIMNFILMRNGYAPVVIESKKKDEYLAALNKADVGDIGAFEEYITKISLHWQDLYLKALKGEKIEEPDDLDKEVELLKKKLIKNKGVKVEISENAVRDVFYNSLLPLLKSIEIKLNKFVDLFAKTTIVIRGRDVNQNLDNFNTVENYFNLFIDKLRSGGGLEVEIGHTGFNKSGTNVFSHYTNLKIQFQTYIYQIQINNSKNNHVEKLYYEYLSLDEIEEISNLLARIELEEIKDRTKT